MTLAPRHPTAPLEPKGYVIRRANGQLLRPAAARLIASGGQSAADLERFLLAASAHDIDLTHLWASFEADEQTAREAVLAVVGTGRTAMVFTSAPKSPRAAPELAEVISKAML